MRETDPYLEQLRSILERFTSLGLCSYPVCAIITSIIQNIIKIFILTETEQAEELLKELLNHKDRRIGYLVLCEILRAEEKGKRLGEGILKELKEFKSDPRNWPICRSADNQLKREKAGLN